MKYESSVTYHPKVMAKIKFFADRQTGQKLQHCTKIVGKGENTGFKHFLL